MRRLHAGEEGPGSVSEGSSSAGIQLDASANGQSVSLGVGQTLQIALPETPTSGYRWTLASGGAPVLELIEDEYLPAAGVAGQSGSHLWLLRAAQTGSVGVELHKVRPWESTQVPVEVFTLSITAD